MAAPAAEGQGIDIPPYFLCPISLQMMRDPVTLPTGITYDRDSIERWIFSSGAGEERATCPVTKQPILPDADATPNHTLRRLIQSWCTANASRGVEPLPTPRQPLDGAQLACLLDEARAPKPTQLASLRRLRSAVGESERNRRNARAAGAPDVLVSVLKTIAATSPHNKEVLSGCWEESLATLHSLKLSPRALSDLAARHGHLVESLTAALRLPSDQSRAYAAFLLRSVVGAVPPASLLSAKGELFEQLVKAVRDGISHEATKAALRALSQLCACGRNRVKAAKAGGVPALVELLLPLEEAEGRVVQTEAAMVVLDQMCRCAEGRADLVAHAAGLAVVSKRVLGVSRLATGRAVGVLYSVSRFAATAAVLREMVQVGVLSKLWLLLLLLVDCGEKTKEKAQYMLRLHSMACSSSPCIPLQLLAS